MQLLNSGRGLEAWLEGAGRGWPERNQEQLMLSRGPLSYAYKLFKVELHSAANQQGSPSMAPPPPLEQVDENSVPEALKSGKSSEHLLDGRSFDGELQLHFYNKHLASSATEAQELANEDSRPNLFAVVSVFLLAAANSSGKASPSAIDFILDNLGALQNQGNSIELELDRSRIESLVPSKREYITYQGSLNRPPCVEGVDWILINKALRVDRVKFQALFERLNTNQENIRPVRALNRRLLRTTISANQQASRQSRPSGGSVRFDCTTIGSRESKVSIVCSCAKWSRAEPGASISGGGSGAKRSRVGRANWRLRRRRRQS